MAARGRLADQVAVITGAGHGIGQAIACAFAAERARVVVADIDADGASATAARSPRMAAVRWRCRPTDVISPDAQDALFGRAKREFDRPDVLVNNAGVFHVAPLLDFPLEARRRGLKLVVSDLLGVGMKAIAEAVTTGQRAGLDWDLLGMSRGFSSQHAPEPAG